MVDGLRPARLSELKAGMTIVAREVGDCLPDGTHTVCRSPEGFFVPCGSGRHMLDTVLEGGDTLPGFWIAPDLPVPQDGILAAWLDAAGDPGGAPPEIIDAVEDVLLERRRQILEKGRTPEKDDATYGPGDAGSALSIAGAAYALAASRQGVLANRVHPAWPGGIKPLGYRAGLVRAAAFILADIERIDRAAAAIGEDGHG